MSHRTQLVRGQTRNGVLKKINQLAAQGWQLQGSIEQERGFGSSTRYAATMVWRANDPGQETVPSLAEPARLTWAIDEIQKLQQRVSALEEQLRARDV